MNRHALPAILPFLAFAAPAASQEDAPTPESIVAASQPGEWIGIPADELLVMQLAPDEAGNPRQVVIQLMPPPFSQPWVDNIRALARDHWWDGTSVYRVVDNWVVQWGAGEGDGFDRKAEPEDIASPHGTFWLSRPEAADFNANLGAAGQATGLAVQPSSPYAEYEDFHRGWPYAGTDGTAWPVHCYGSVGVSRAVGDTGSGAELYAVIGHAPRQLDRNIAVVGRVIDGIEHFSTLPRGTGNFGVYKDRASDTPILTVRLASELAATDTARYEYLATGSESFERYLAQRANRQDEFYAVPAGGVDICNVKVPVRPVGSAGG